jgi:hypothetical protein
VASKSSFFGGTDAGKATERRASKWVRDLLTAFRLLEPESGITNCTRKPLGLSAENRDGKGRAG